MAGQLCRLDFHQVGFHVLDNAIANFRRQLLDDRAVDRRRRGKGPSVFSLALNDVDDAVRQLFHDAPVVFVFDPGPLGDRVSLSGRSAAGKRACLIGHLVLITAVRVSGVERLDELEARATRRGFVDFVGFEGAAIRHDDQRSRCHVSKMVRRPEAIRFG